MFRNSRKGVSLITVLLFMMIATIAATATFKWLSSAGQSSASRLQKSEAEQAALAGIASARSWMTYHGDETGAAIRQFLAQDEGERYPIRLTNVLKSLTNSNNSQDFDVWMVDANTSSVPYTVKLVSMGKAKNGTKYSEVAVLKVSGLYQVQVPTKSKSIGFNDAFYGSLASAGNLKVSSATINGSPDATNGGGAAFSEVEVTGDLIITGRAEFNSSTKVENLYVMEDFVTCTNVKVTGNAYIGGKMYAPMGGKGDTINGDLYVDGGFDLRSRGPSEMGGCGGSVGGNIVVNGNLTLGSSSYMPINNASWNVLINGNLVEDDKLIFNANGNGNQSTFNFNVKGNSYIANGIEGSHLYYDVEYVTFGDALTSTAMYAPGLYKLNDKYTDEGIPNSYYCNNADCDKNASSANDAFFKIWGSYHTGSPSSSELSTWRADRLEDIKATISTGGKEKGCETDAYVKDPIQFNQDLLSASEKLTSSNKGTCSGTDSYHNLWAQWPGDWVALMNSCYNSEQGASKLYKDKWLITEFSTPPAWAGSSTLLDGNFIWIIEGSSPNYQLDLPDMTENSQVLLYFPHGWNATLTLNRSSGGKKNYFIYSDGNIKDFQMDQSNPLTGSIFMANCTALNTGTHNASVSATVNSSLTNALAEIGAICNNDETDKCSTTGGSSSISGSTSTSSGTNDSYYIAVSPQLYIRTESQYKNDEISVNNLESKSENLKPSVLILPRVLYLPANPYGKLSDYYDVVNLNGASETKNPGSVTCSPASLPTLSSFSSYGDLNDGIYQCNYAGNTYGSIPFYVVVSGDLGNAPTIQFVEQNQEINKGETKNVTVKIAKSTTAKPVSVDVYQSPTPDNWIITGADAYKTNSDGSKMYTITVTPSATEEKTFKLFSVNMPDNGETSAVTFQMTDPCDGCIIGHEYDRTTVVAGGNFNVRIKSIKDYCSSDAYKDTEDCKEGGKYYKIMQAETNGESCSEMVGSSAFVRVNGIGCSQKTVNDLWECSVFINPDVELKSLRSTAHTTCEVTTAPKEIYSAQVDVEDTLYASITRRAYPLYVKISGAKNGSSVKVTYSKNQSASQGDLDLGECSDSKCTYTAYHGYKYFFTYDESGDDEFATWKCEGSNCTPVGSYKTYPLAVSDTHTVTARFNEEDEHCFFEDFDDDDKGVVFPTSFCDGSKKRCIDTCDYKPLGIGKSCSISESVHASSKPEWVMVYDNRPITSKMTNRSVFYDQTKCTQIDIGLSALKYYRYDPVGCEKRIYDNTSKDYTKKVLYPNVSGGSIAANANSEYPNDINGTQAVILSTKLTGTNGTLTSLFTTDVLATMFRIPTTLSEWKDFFNGSSHESRYDMENSGFIFRSNADASEYFSLSVYGLDNLNGNYSDKVYAHLCLVKEQTAASTGRTRCETATLETNAWETTGSALADLTQELAQGLGFTTSTKFNLSVKISGSLVTLDIILDRIAVKSGQKSIQFDLKSLFGETLEGNEYVGLKLSNPKFKVYDISWQSDTYSGDCWATPRIICSFRTNYAGGIVPLEEDASPWVTLSSFEETDYESSGCTIKYYYNGCDNTTTDDAWTNYSSDDLWGNLYNSSSCNHNPDNLGLYWDDGSTISSSTYNFVREGSHGYAHQSGTGFVRDAKVKLDCQSASATPPSSLTASQSCGQFVVGDIELCDKNYDFMESSSDAISCTAGEKCTLNYTTAANKSTANLRGTAIYYKLSNPDCSGDVILNAIDSLGNSSENIKISSNGNSNFNMDDYSDADGFDPQSVVKFQFYSDECNFEVQHLESECPYALGISNCSATYNGSSWLISAEYRNADECTVVVPSNSSADNSSLDGTCASTFRLPETGLLANADAQTYTFQLTVKNNSTNEEVTKECTPYEVTPVEVGCSLSSYEVNQGEGVPTLTYTLSGCPTGGCSYSVTLGDVMTSGVTSTAINTQTFENINTVANKLTPGTYKYVIDAQGKKNENCSFTVKDADASKSAQPSGCYFSESTKQFTANVTYTGSDWSAAFYVVDGLGNVLGNVGSISSSTGDYIAQDLSSVPFTVGKNVITLVMNNSDAQTDRCTADYTVAASSSSATSSSSSATATSAESGTPLCLIRNEDDNTLKNHPKIYNVPAGTYTLKHNCGSTTSWYLYCTNGKTITMGGHTYNCHGSKEESNQQSANNGTGYSIPASGTVFTIDPGVTITSMSCVIDYNTNADPEGCTSNFYNPASSSSSVAESSSSSADVAYSASCRFDGVTETYGPFSTNFIAENFSVKTSEYVVDLYDPDGNIVHSFTINKDKWNEYKWMSFNPSKPGTYTYSLKKYLTGETLCTITYEAKNPKITGCSASPSAITPVNQWSANDIYVSGKTDVSNKQVYFDIYLDGNKVVSPNPYIGEDGSFNVWATKISHTDLGKHKIVLQSKESVLCETSVSVGYKPECDFDANPSTVKTYGSNGQYTFGVVAGSSISNCGDEYGGCSYVVKDDKGNTVASGTQTINSGTTLTNIDFHSLNRGSHTYTVNLTNTLGSSSCNFVVKRTY